MMLKLSIVEQLIVPSAIIVSSLIVGVLLRNGILVILQRLAKKTRWRFDDIVIGALRSSVIFWSLALGLYILVQTQGFSHEASENFSKALGVLVIFSVTVAVSQIGTEMIEYYKSTVAGLASAASLLKNVVRVMVYSVGALVILDELRISIAPLLTALGVGGLAIGLGMQETLSNFFAGLQILAARQIQIGNYIKLSSGEEGYVEDLNWQATIIKTLSGNRVVIPNKNMAGLIITNYQLPSPDIGISLDMFVDYRSDLQKVERVTVEEAREIQRTVPGATRNYEPSVRFTKFGDSAIYFSVNLRVDTYADQYLVKHELIMRLKRRYESEKIIIPFPIQTVFLKRGLVRDGTKTG
jgi:small-conductance mechanosensitive channel